MLVSLMWFILAFILLWIGSGMVVSTVTQLSRSIHISSFFISFFVLGVFSSTTEIMVGLNALIQNEPEIFVGNLIGSSVVVLLLVLPLLAIFANGVKLNHSFALRDLVSVAVVVGLPALLTLDNRISFVDGLVCVVMYSYFVFMQERKSGSINKLIHISLKRSTLYISLLKIIAAMVLVFTASNVLVNQTQILGNYLNVSPYIISMLILSLGTNIPETSIAIRSVLANKKDIAFGNYLGSASFNTLELGVLTLISTTPISAAGSNYSILAFLGGLAFFVYAGRSRQTISRQEGFVLVGAYVLFVIFELLGGSGWTFRAV